MSAVTAVIGNYNGEALLADCIESLVRQAHPPVAVLVVDGGSNDESEAVAREHGAEFIPERNLGLGRLYNRGARASRTDYVFFANNDIALDPSCLGRLSAVLDANPTAFAADARQLDWDGTNTIHARTTLTRGALVREHLPGLHLDHNVDAAAVTSTVCANGAAMMVRRSMFDELAGFDESFFMEWEDLDLCWRAWHRGWSTLYVPTAVVRHRVGAVTSAAIKPRRSASSHHNLMRFALKCLPPAAACRVLLGELLRIPRHPRAIVYGALAVAREAGEIRRIRKRDPPSRALLTSVLTGFPGVIEQRVDGPELG